MPGIWTSLTFHHRSISWPIDRVFRIPLVIAWRPEVTTLLTAFPRAAMLVLIVRIAQAEAFVLHLAAPTPSKRKKGRITTNPLLTTRRFDQRRRRIAAESTMLAGYRFGFHSVISHGLSLFVGIGLSSRELAHPMHGSANRSIPCDHVHLNPRPTPARGCPQGGLSESVRDESIF